MTRVTRDWRNHELREVIVIVAAFAPRLHYRDANAQRQTIVAVSSAATLIEICVRCEQCGSEWVISAAAPPLFLKRKPDRRKS